jgi:hypothetical protein
VKDLKMLQRLLSSLLKEPRPVRFAAAQDRTSSSALRSSLHPILYTPVIFES